MAYVLGGLTLPNPKRFERVPIEAAQSNLSITGRTRKKVLNRKERFVLEFQHLTQAQLNAILAIEEQNACQSFSVSDGDLTIPETEVLIEIPVIVHPLSGKEYRVNIQMILEEVI